MNVIKSKKNIKLFLGVYLFVFKIDSFISMFPASLGPRLFNISPVGLINALIPLLADLIV